VKNLIGVKELQMFLRDNKKAALHRCITQKLLVYGLGRGLSYKDRLTIDEVLASFANDQINFADLLFKIIASKPFQFSR